MLGEEEGKKLEIHLRKDKLSVGLLQSCKTLEMETQKKRVGVPEGLRIM